MGHMRSRSSLLCHILMSNKDIIGIGESNLVYDSRISFLKLILKSKYYNNQFFVAPKYYVDQINHNQKTPTKDLILIDNSKFIFLIRNPIDSINSLQKLTKEFYKPWPIEKCVNYYNSRLSYILALFPKIKTEYIIIDSDNLIQNTDLSLLNISKYLSLDQQLTENYNLFSFTGKHGDPSENISAGKILVKGKSTSMLNIDLKQSYSLYHSLINR